MLSNFKTPVLFIVFNRVDTTKRVFEAIRKVRPDKLFIAADGPRPGRGEEGLCKEVRQVISHVDWDCEVHTLYRDQNLGCGKAVSSAINWFFEQVEEGIILEDDTLPNESFFQFCESLLEKYRHNKEIAHINGSNFQLGKKRGKASYYFSHYPMIWGWATWRRAWKEYEFDMRSYPSVSSSPGFWSIFNRSKEIAYWKTIFDNMYEGLATGNITIDTWDYQWYYSCFKQKKLVVTPNENLISNIGFGENATHTKSKSLVSYLPFAELGTINHLERIIVSKRADIKVFDIYFLPPIGLLGQFRLFSLKLLPVSFVKTVRKWKHKMIGKTAL
jgi:hypothetical protein